MYEEMSCPKELASQEQKKKEEFVYGLFFFTARREMPELLAVYKTEAGAKKSLGYRERANRKPLTKFEIKKLPLRD